MENLNFKLAQIELQLNQLLNGIPVGIAYFILKTKTNELEDAYYEQAKKEMDAVAAQFDLQTESQNEQIQTEPQDEQIQTEIQDEPTTA